METTTRKLETTPLLNTVRAEIITELIPERVGPVIFNSFLLELITSDRFQ